MEEMLSFRDWFNKSRLSISDKDPRDVLMVPYRNTVYAVRFIGVLTTYYAEVTLYIYKHASIEHIKKITIPSKFIGDIYAHDPKPSGELYSIKLTETEFTRRLKSIIDLSEKTELQESVYLDGIFYEYKTKEI